MFVVRGSRDVTANAITSVLVVKGVMMLTSPVPPCSVTLYCMYGVLYRLPIPKTGAVKHGNSSESLTELLLELLEAKQIDNFFKCDHGSLPPMLSPCPNAAQCQTPIHRQCADSSLSSSVATTKGPPPLFFSVPAPFFHPLSPMFWISLICALFPTARPNWTSPWTISFAKGDNSKHPTLTLTLLPSSTSRFVVSLRSHNPLWERRPGLLGSFFLVNGSQTTSMHARGNALDSIMPRTSK